MYGLLLVFMQFFTIFLMFLSGPLTPNNSTSFILFVAGVSLGLYSLWYMRKSKIRILPAVSQKAVLITDGPYSIIRHPMYTAVLLVGISMFLNDFSQIRLIIYIVLLITLLLKIQYEEKLLSAHFQEYSEYKKRTAKLIPFIY